MAKCGKKLKGVEIDPVKPIEIEGDKKPPRRTVWLMFSRSL